VVQLSIRAEWERCRPWIEDALKRDGGFYSIEDVEQEIATHNAHFWPGKQAAAVCQWWFFPRAKVLNMWLAGGDMAELVNEMYPACERWAIEHDATHLSLAGRKGWERVFAPFGFKPQAVYLLKEITA